MKRLPEDYKKETVTAPHFRVIVLGAPVRVCLALVTAADTHPFPGIRKIESDCRAEGRSDARSFSLPAVAFLLEPEEGSRYNRNRHAGSERKAGLAAGCRFLGIFLAGGTAFLGMRFSNYSCAGRRSSTSTSCTCRLAGCT